MKAVEVESSVWSGVKIGFGIFVVLPLLILAGVAAAIVIWLQHAI